MPRTFNAVDKGVRVLLHKHSTIENGGCVDL